MPFRYDGARPPIHQGRESFLSREDGDRFRASLSLFTGSDARTVCFADRLVEVTTLRRSTETANETPGRRRDALSVASFVRPEVPPPDSAPNGHLPRACRILSPASIFRAAREEPPLPTQPASARDPFPFPARRLVRPLSSAVPLSPPSLHFIAHSKFRVHLRRGIRLRLRDALAVLAGVVVPAQPHLVLALAPLAPVPVLPVAHALCGENEGKRNRGDERRYRVSGRERGVSSGGRDARGTDRSSERASLSPPVVAVAAPVSGGHHPSGRSGASRGA